MIGSAALFRHVSDGGCRIVNHTDRATEADVVVVAGHDGFDFDELRTATSVAARRRRDARLPRDADVPDR